MILSINTRENKHVSKSHHLYTCLMDPSNASEISMLLIDLTRKLNELCGRLEDLLADFADAMAEDPDTDTNLD